MEERESSNHSLKLLHLTPPKTLLNLRLRHPGPTYPLNKCTNVCKGVVRDDTIFSEISPIATASIPPSPPLLHLSAASRLSSVIALEYENDDEFDKDDDDDELPFEVQLLDFGDMVIRREEYNCICCVYVYR